MIPLKGIVGATRSTKTRSVPPEPSPTLLANSLPLVSEHGRAEKVGRQLQLPGLGFAADAEEREGKRTEKQSATHDRASRFDTMGTIVAVSSVSDCAGDAEQRRALTREYLPPEKEGRSLRTRARGTSSASRRSRRASGTASGPDFWARVDVLGDEAYHLPIDMRV